jgi:hypothetical protein
MANEVILDVTTIEENVTVETTAGDVVEVNVVATQGAAATISVGTTTTGAAGTNASVTNSGTTSAAVLNFTIPRGATGATGAAGPNSVTSATTSDGTAELEIQSLQTSNISVIPNGGISLTSTNSGGYVRLNGQSATDARNIAFPNASGTVALTSSMVGEINSVDITDASTTPVYNESTESFEEVAALYNENGEINAAGFITEGGSFYSYFGDDFVSISFAQSPLNFKIGTKQFRFNQPIGNGGQYTVPDASGTLALTASTTGVPDKLTDGTIAGTLTINSTSYTYGAGAAVAHRTALGVSASGDTVLKSAYTPAHSLLVQQSGTGSPSSLSVGNNTILGRASGGGSDIAALSASDARTVLGLTTLATTTPAANVATFLETPSSANLAAAVTDETGSGSLVFATSPTLSNLTVSGTGIVATLGTDPAVLAVGTPATTGAFVGGYYTSGANNSTIYFGQNSYFAGGQWTQPNTSATSSTMLIQNNNFLFYTQSAGNPTNAIGALRARITASGMAIGSAVPNTKAALDVQSTTQGFLPPRMTTTQRNAITSVPAGLMVYNTTTNKLNFYNGSAWEAVTSA